MGKVKVGQLVNYVDPQKLLAGPVGGEKAIHDLGQACDAASAQRQKVRERKAAKKGRPKGAANAAVDQTDGQLTACAKCGSTKREPYFNRRELDVAGVHAITRQPYTQIVVRRTRCGDCGQARDDRHFVNQPLKGKSRGNRVV